MQVTTITASSLKTISWFKNIIVDWVSSDKQYLPDGKIVQLSESHFPFTFNGAINSANGVYVFIYQRFGTKGLLLRNGEIIREVNRSYYFADVYEFPCAFAEVDSVTYLIHCPIAYNQLDFENVETGALVTNIPDRKPENIFHSRLEISPNSNLIMDKGWLWHPLEVVCVFNIKDCINNPKLLDQFALQPPVGVEICSASFINNEHVLIGSSDEVIDDENLNMGAKHVAIWDLKENKILKQIAVNEEFGNLFAIDEDQAWDLYDFPKIINVNTGEVIIAEKSINSGKQRSSIVVKATEAPQIIFNHETKQIAIALDDRIELINPR